MEPFVAPPGHREQLGTIVRQCSEFARPVEDCSPGDHLPVIRRLCSTGTVTEGVALVLKMFVSERQILVQPPDCEHLPINLPWQATWESVDEMRKFLRVFVERESFTGKRAVMGYKKRLRLGPLGGRCSQKELGS